jgi:hypothetical protein
MAIQLLRDWLSTAHLIQITGQVAETSSFKKSPWNERGLPSERMQALDLSTKTRRRNWKIGAAVLLITFVAYVPARAISI